MQNSTRASRRKFLQQIGSSSLLLAASPLASLAAKEKAEQRTLFYEKKISPNDKVRLAVIGFGIQGHFDLATALKVPGVELGWQFAISIPDGLKTQKNYMAKIFSPPKITWNYWTAKMLMPSSLQPATIGTHGSPKKR